MEVGEFYNIRKVYEGLFFFRRYNKEWRDKKILRYTLFDNEINGKRILTYIKRIRHFIKNNNIDIVVDIDGILDMYTIPALRKSDCKVISWEQFNYYQNPYVNYRKYTRRLAARKADAVVVLTDEDKGYYRKK